MFSKISIEGWRQFRHIEIDFHPRLTILTGANGAGKTTLLSLISRHLGWSAQFIATPGRGAAGSNSLGYSPDLWELSKLLEDSAEYSEVTQTPTLDAASDIVRIETANAQVSAVALSLALADARKARKAEASAKRNNGAMTVIGSITYSSGLKPSLQIQTSGGQYVYDVQIQNQQHVEGVHVSSHRSPSAYQQIQNIPTIPRRRGDVFNNYVSLLRSRLSGQHTQWSPQYYMKETLIALATFGYGNLAVEADLESARIFEEFQSILAQMLPPSLGFQRLLVKIPEVILETSTGSFSLDALSGGASAVVELAWQIFMFQPTADRFVVTLDEPENHLHPELQRRVLADLLKAFPHAQFVVATHSPFIVGSVPESSVYALAYDHSNSVISHLIDSANKAGSANDILRQVLGVDVTIPIWAETKIQHLINQYATRDFSSEVIAELRTEMRSLGLELHMSQAIAQLAAKKDQE